MERRDVRKSRWFEDVADYFDLDSSLLQRAVPAPPERNPPPRHQRRAERLRPDVLLRGDPPLYRAAPGGLQATARGGRLRVWIIAGHAHDRAGLWRARDDHLRRRGEIRG